MQGGRFPLLILATNIARVNPYSANYHDRSWTLPYRSIAALLFDFAFRAIEHDYWRVGECYPRLLGGWGELGTGHSIKRRRFAALQKRGVITTIGL